MWTALELVLLDADISMQISTSFESLLRADFRLMKYIVAELVTQTQNTLDIDIKANAAFQLAVCYSAGLGIRRDTPIAASWLTQSGGSEQDLRDEMARASSNESYSGELAKSLAFNRDLYTLHNESWENNRVVLHRRETYYSELAEDMEKCFGQNSHWVLHAQSQLAATVHTSGRYIEAQRMFSDLYETLSKREGYGPTHVATLDMLNRRAAIHSQLGNNKRAEADYRVLFEAYEQDLGYNRLETLASIKGLATALCDQGEYQESEGLSRLAFERCKALYGETHSVTLTFLGSYSNILLAKEKLEDARVLMTEVIQKRKRLFGCGNTETIAIQLSMVTLLRQRNQFRDAETLARGILQEVRESYGEDHPDYFSALVELAMLAHDLGNSEESKQINFEILAWKTTLEDDGRSVLSINSKFAVNLFEQGEFKEALNLSQLVMKKEIAIFGVENSHVLTSLHNIAACLHGMEDYASATKIFSSLVQTRTRLLGRDHSKTLETSIDLAASLISAEEFELSEKVIEQTMKVCEVKFGPLHRITLGCFMVQAALELEKGNTVEGLELTMRLAQGRSSTLGDDHPLTINAVGELTQMLDELANRSEETDDFEAQPGNFNRRENLLTAYHKHGGFLIKRNLLDEAHSNISKAQHGFDELLGKSHAKYLEATGDLAVILIMQGQLNTGLPMLESLCEEKLRILGPAHPSTLRSQANLSQARQLVRE